MLRHKSGNAYSKIAALSSNSEKSYGSLPLLPTSFRARRFGYLSVPERKI
jgi:hypothetical protein